MDFCLPWSLVYPLHCDTHQDMETVSQLVLKPRTSWVLWNEIRICQILSHFLKLWREPETMAFPSCHGLLIPGIPCKILESVIPGNVFTGMRLGVYFPGIPLTVLFYFWRREKILLKIMYKVCGQGIIPLGSTPQDGRVNCSVFSSAHRTELDQHLLKN